jgi:hypothetical protein
MALLSILVALAYLAACTEKTELSTGVSTVVIVSDTAYALGQQQINSKDELLRLIKATVIHEPVVVNWSIRGGEEGTRKLAEARATEIRAMLKSAGIKVSDVAVGNEIFEAKP